MQQTYNKSEADVVMRRRTTEPLLNNGRQKIWGKNAN